MEVLEGVWLGGDFEELQDGLKTGNFDPGYCRFFAGYAGWGSEQLQQEFLSGAWMAIPATVELVFDTPPEKLWSSAVRQWGKEDPIYSNYPEDPSWN